MTGPSQNLRNQVATRAAADAAPTGGPTQAPPTIFQMIERQKAEIGRALPQHMNPDRLARVIMTVIRQTPQLLECTHASLLGAAMLSAQTGLEPGPLGHCYWLPFRNSRAGTMEVTWIMGYKGMIDLARRSGQLVSIEARAVRQNDLFEFEYGLDERLRHVPAEGERGDLTKVYMIARFKDGGRYFRVMTRAEVEEHRNRSKAKDRGPWVTDYEAMACKGLAVDTPIPTPYGFTKMGDLEVGDVVFDLDGQETRVLGTTEVKHIGCYRVTFGDGSSIVCDDEHRWWASLAPGTRLGRRNGVRRAALAVHSIGDMYAAKQAGRAVTVPVAGALDLPELYLPVSPYVLGMWLGDGNRANATVTSSEADLNATIANLEAAGAIIGTIRRDPRSNAVAIGLRGGLRKKLADVGVLGDKHVPAPYLRASFGQRLALLRGLMDADGTATARRRAVFDNTDLRLADAVAELACSLGETVIRSSRTVTGYGHTVVAHRVSWTPSVCPFLMPRKAARLPGRQVAPYRVVKSIEPIPSVATRCIYVDSPTSSYLAGERMVPTHNTVIRAAAAFLPLSVEVAQAAIADDTVHRGVVNVQDMGYALPEMPPPAPALEQATSQSGEVYNAATGEVEPAGDPEATRDRTIEADRQREAAEAAAHAGGDEAPAPDVEEPPALPADWPETQTPGSKRTTR